MVHALLILTRKYKNTGAGYEREILHSTKVWAPSVRRVRACNLVGREGHLNGKEVRAHKYSDAHSNIDKVTKNDLQWFQHAILTRPPPFFLLLSPCNRRCKQNTHIAPTRCPLTRLPPFLYSQGVARKFVHERMKWKVCFDNGSNAEISEGNLIRVKNRRDSMPTLGHKPLDPIRRETQPAACCFEREDLRMGAFRATRYSLGRADGGGNLLSRAHSAYLPTIHVEVGGADDELLPSIAEQKKDLVQQFVSRTNWKQSLDSRQGSRSVSRFKLVDNGGVAVMEEIWSQHAVCEKKKMEEDFKQVCVIIQKHLQGVECPVFSIVAVTLST